MSLVNTEVLKRPDGGGDAYCEWEIIKGRISMKRKIQKRIVTHGGLRCQTIPVLRY
jgi:hypothetical protein